MGTVAEEIVRSTWFAIPAYQGSKSAAGCADIYKLVSPVYHKKVMENYRT